MTMTVEEILKKFPSAKVVETLDNTEWREGVEKGRKILEGEAPKGKAKKKEKMFVMLDKNASPEENLKTIEIAIKEYDG